MYMYMKLKKFGLIFGLFCLLFAYATRVWVSTNFREEKASRTAILLVTMFRTCIEKSSASRLSLAMCRLPQPWDTNPEVIDLSGRLGDSSSYLSRSFITPGAV